MLVNRIMRKPVTVITPDTPVQAAAALMAKLEVGALPICENGRLVGIVTDRDIVVRWAMKVVCDRPVSEIMTPRVATCLADQTVEQAAYLMSDLQVRRLVVLNGEEEVVGMLTVGDIANDVSEELAGQTLGEIVEAR
ncbi:CBS domain-containing protein [Roseovarius sp. SCSIO 43702]|nr:CBS domain-containing protein [Roseovarius sp. SCSIO 43702]